MIDGSVCPIPFGGFWVAALGDSLGAERGFQYSRERHFDAASTSSSSKHNCSLIFFFLFDKCLRLARWALRFGSCPVLKTWARFSSSHCEVLVSLKALFFFFSPSGCERSTKFTEVIKFPLMLSQSCSQLDLLLMNKNICGIVQTDPGPNPVNAFFFSWHRTIKNSEPAADSQTKLILVVGHKRAPLPFAFKWRYSVSH